MATAARPILLLDVDGVLLEIGLYDAEWERLADQVIGPLLGTRAGGWAALQRAAWLETTRRVAGALWKLSADERPSPATFWDELLEQWIAQLCRSAALDAPASAEERARLGQRVFAGYLRHTQAVVPGAAESIAALSGRFELHMASGNPAFIVEGVLERIGVRELVGFPFGSDLAGAYKEESPRFYTAICERLGAQAADVWVIDDRDTHLVAARGLGARTIKIGPPEAGIRHDLVVESLGGVLAGLDALERAR